MPDMQRTCDADFQLMGETKSVPSTMLELRPYCITLYERAAVSQSISKLLFAGHFERPRTHICSNLNLLSHCRMEY
ncbi:hypothetical protein DAI22_10g150001 [Oryza sativa Japonica Group]|nr:hypothetical protein DAI22_10g150001 [Oryza sativa Japonica Group]